MHSALKEVKGSYAIAVLDKNNSNEIIVARHGSPLLIGVGEDSNFIASDAHALIEHTNQFIYLDDGDMASVSSSEINIFDKDKNSVNREIKKVTFH